MAIHYNVCEYSSGGKQKGSCQDSLCGPRWCGCGPARNLSVGNGVRISHCTLNTTGFSFHLDSTLRPFQEFAS